MSLKEKREHIKNKLAGHIGENVYSPFNLQTKNRPERPFGRKKNPRSTTTTYDAEGAGYEKSIKNIIKDSYNRYEILKDSDEPEELNYIYKEKIKNSTYANFYIVTKNLLNSEELYHIGVKDLVLVEPNKKILAKYALSEEVLSTIIKEELRFVFGENKPIFLNRNKKFHRGTAKPKTSSGKFPQVETESFRFSIMFGKRVYEMDRFFAEISIHPTEKDAKAKVLSMEKEGKRQHPKVVKLNKYLGELKALANTYLDLEPEDLIGEIEEILNNASYNFYANACKLTLEEVPCFIGQDGSIFNTISKLCTVSKVLEKIIEVAKNNLPDALKAWFEWLKESIKKIEDAMDGEIVKCPPSSP